MKKDKGIGSPALANLATTALAAKAVSQSGGGRDNSAPSGLKEAFLRNPIKWIIVGSVAGFVLYRVGKSIVRSIQGGASQRDDTKKLKAQERLNRQAGQKANYTTYEYKTMADAAFEALRGNTEDEEDLLPIMQKMKSDLDLTLLIKEYGTRDHSAGWNPRKVMHTLPSAIAAYYFEDELEDYINKPLRQNGVKFQFSL